MIVHVFVGWGQKVEKEEEESGLDIQTALNVLELNLNDVLTSILAEYVSWIDSYSFPFVFYCLEYASNLFQISTLMPFVLTFQSSLNPFLLLFIHWIY